MMADLNDVHRTLELILKELQDMRQDQAQHLAMMDVITRTLTTEEKFPGPSKTVLSKLRDIAINTNSISNWTAVR
jgi:hypothetical protein